MTTTATKLARHLARLCYPSAWRARYGEELDGLLEDCHPGWKEIIDVIKGGFAMRLNSRWGLTTACGLLGLAAGTAVFLAIPRMYASSGLLAAKGGPEAVAHAIERHFTSANFEKLIERHNLYQSERGRKSQGELLHHMKKHIYTSPVSPNGMVRVSFAYDDPQVAQRVAREIMVLLLDDKAANVEVADLPSLSQDPIKPNRHLPWFGLFAGALLGLAIAAIRSRYTGT